MVEVQHHGFTFENWVCNLFFQGHRGGYSDEWDVPAEKNSDHTVPDLFRGVPVSIKSTAFGASIGLGDILRQRRINCAFLMIVGFWKQQTATEKQIEDIGVAFFPAALWENLWGDLSFALVQEIDAIAKNRLITPEEGQRNARLWKRSTSAVKTSAIVVNPKIDSTNRRVQCSLRFNAFWNHVGRSAARQDRPLLFGIEFSNPIFSKARSFKAAPKLGDPKP